MRRMICVCFSFVCIVRIIGPSPLEPIRKEA